MAFQGIFRRGSTLVVVRPIILSSKCRLEVGTVIDPKKHNIRPFQLRILFRKRRLGTEGSAWANEMIKGQANPSARPETKVISDAKANNSTAAKEAAAQKAEDKKTAAAAKKAEAAKKKEVAAAKRKATAAAKKEAAAKKKADAAAAKEEPSNKPKWSKS